MSELLVCPIEIIVGNGIEMIFYESLLRLVAPEVAHESINQWAFLSRDVAIDDHRRMLTENRSLGHDDLDGRVCLFHQQPLKLISNQGVAVAKFEGCPRLARRAGSRDNILPDCLQGLQSTSLVGIAALFLGLDQFRAVNRQDGPLSSARADGIRMN